MLGIGGNVGVLFGLCCVPIVAAMGFAVDYSRLSDIRTEMQAEADAAALAARGGTWISETQYRVTDRREVEMTLMSVVGYDRMAVEVEAVALFPEPGWFYDPPIMTYLDPSANDYNRMGVYCYNTSTHQRGPVTDIADNNGNIYDFRMPVCPEGSALGLRLLNIFNGRVTPSEITNPAADTDVYYSDENAHAHLLETMRCDSAQDCRPQSQGGIIVEGPGRTPTHDTRDCATGKYMYYGWEDRETGLGADRDYNDIMIVIKCPTWMDEFRRNARLLR
jgi:hypothetical protein